MSIIKKIGLSIILACAFIFQLSAAPDILSVDNVTHVLNRSNFVGSTATFGNLYVKSNRVLTIGDSSGGFVTNGGSANFSYLTVNNNVVLTNADAQGAATNAVYGYSNYVSQTYYPKSNPSNFVDRTVTNGLASIIFTTNSIANYSNYVNQIYYPNTNPSNFVDKTITNGLASIIFTTNLVTNTSNVLKNSINLVQTNLNIAVSNLTLGDSLRTIQFDSNAWYSVTNNLPMFNQIFMATNYVTITNIVTNALLSCVYSNLIDKFTVINYAGNIISNPGVFNGLQSDASVNRQLLFSL